jgi:hypothetical protein
MPATVDPPAERRRSKGNSTRCRRTAPGGQGTIVCFLTSLVDDTSPVVALSLLSCKPPIFTSALLLRSSWDCASEHIEYAEPALCT